MKHRYFIISIFIVIGTHQCYSMKAPLKNSSNFVKTDIIQRITTVEFPQSILCFPNNIVAIEGIKECSIYDTAKKKEIHRIKNDEDIKCIAKHPTKPLLAILSEEIFPKNTLRIYEIPRIRIIAEFSYNHLDKPLVFNAINDTVIAKCYHNSLRIFNYRTLEDVGTYDTNNISSPIFTSHQKNTELALLSSSIIAIFSTEKNFQFKTQYNDRINSFINLLTYSADGSLIIGKTYDYLYYIADSTSNKISSYNSNDQWFHSIAISPISFIMASYNIKNNRIDYRNLKKDESIIASTKLPSKENQHYFHQQYINFSSDGTKMYIALYKECLELKTHFNALYAEITEEKCIFALCALNNFFQQTNNHVPNDIKYLLIKTVLEKSQYSFTNY